MQFAKISEDAGGVVCADGGVVLVDVRVCEHLVALDVQQSLARRQQRALQAEAGLVELRRLDPVFERRVEVGGAEVERDDARRVLERRVQQLERVAPVTRAVQDVGQVQQRNVLKQ